MLTCTGLTCEYRIDPVGIDETRPRLGWRLESDRADVLQTAYGRGLEYRYTKFGIKI